MQRTELPWTLGSIAVNGASAYGEALFLGDDHIFALQAVWPSGIEGDILLQASVDGEVYEDIPSSSQAVSAAGSYMWNYTSCGFNYVRPYFDWDSGTGVTIKIKADTKGAK